MQKPCYITLPTINIRKKSLCKQVYFSSWFHTQLPKALAYRWEVVKWKGLWGERRFYKAPLDETAESSHLCLGTNEWDGCRLLVPPLSLAVLWWRIKEKNWEFCPPVSLKYKLCMWWGEQIGLKGIQISCKLYSWKIQLQ